MTKVSGKRKIYNAVPAFKLAKRRRKQGFSYDRLPAGHIRILQVTCEHKRNDRQTMSTELRSFPVDRLPYFLALSYAWPDAAAPTQSLRCNDRYITISTHVHTAFENLCATNSACSFAIWVDAICIDQENDLEKSNQVSHMGSIYSLAGQVIVWLGPNQLVDEHRYMIQFLARWVENIPEEEWGQIIQKPPFPPRSHPVRKAIDSMVLSRWFQRLWVVQEVCLASQVKVLCGRCFMPWDSLRAFFLWEGTTLWSPLEPESDIQRGISHGQAISACRERTFAYHYDPQNQYGQDYSGLIATIDDLRSQNVSNPVDMVYGFIFILPEEIRRKIVIDYSSENHYWKVYVSLARILLPLEGGLKVLYHAQSKNRAPELPSWCPDWNIARNGVPDRIVLGTDSGLRLSSGGHRSSARVRLGVNIRHVRVRGFQIDRIASSTPGAPLEAHDAKRGKAWSLWQHRCLRALNTWLENNAIDYDPIFAAKMHLNNLTLGLWNANDSDGTATPNAPAFSESDWPEMDKCYRELVSYCRDATREAEDFVFNMGDGAYKFYQSSLEQDRSYFITQNGRVGRGFSEERPGDILVVLYGAPTPFILRYEEGSDSATLIGDAYLYDCMNWKTMPSVGRGRNEWFTIG